LLTILTYNRDRGLQPYADTTPIIDIGARQFAGRLPRQSIDKHQRMKRAHSRKLATMAVSDDK
jgi:hypothetical protein